MRGLLTGLFLESLRQGFCSQEKILWERIIETKAKHAAIDPDDFAECFPVSDL